MRRKYPGIINVVLGIVVIAALMVTLMIPTVALASDQQLVTFDHGVQALTMVPPAVTADGSGSALMDVLTNLPGATTWSFAQIQPIQPLYGFGQLTTYLTAITCFTLTTRAPPLSVATHGVMDQWTTYGRRSGVGISPHPVLGALQHSYGRLMYRDHVTGYLTQHRIVHGMTLGVT